MTTLVHIPDQRLFDIPSEFSIPVDLTAGVLNENGDYVSGGTISFDLPKTPNNESIIGDGRGMIKVVLQQGASTVVGEMIVQSYTKRNYSVEIEDIRTSAFRRLKDLPARSVYMDDLDHAWTFTNVLAERTAGWVYPLVDYGWMSKRSATLQDRNFKGDVRNDIFNFRPAIFAYDFIQRAFNQIGWNVTLPEGWFKSLAIPNVTPMLKGEDAIEESGAMYLTANAPETTLTKVPFDLGTGSNFDTVNHRYVATSPSMVNYRALVPAFNGEDADKFVNVYLFVNGIQRAATARLIPAGATENVVLQGQIFLETNDYVEVFTAMPFNSPVIEFPGAGSRLEISVVDTLAFGSTIRMADTLPDVSAADLIKWVLASVNSVFDSGNSELSIKLFYEYYTGIQELTIDVDSWQATNKGELGQNNYLSYSGDPFANGGFRIEDSRLDREKELFTSGFVATKMGITFGGLATLALLYSSLPEQPATVSSLLRGATDFFGINPLDQSPRILLVKYVSVTSVIATGDAIQIGDIMHDANVNVGYFYDDVISLSFNDLSDGINLTELCYADYAADFAKYEQVNVKCALLPGQVNAFDFSKLVSHEGRLYRIMSVNGYVDGQLADLTLRRVGMDPSALSVLRRIGDTASLSTAGASLDDEPIALLPMNRVQLFFDDYTDPNLHPLPSTVYQDAGLFGDPPTDLAATIPASGYYAIFFQVTAGIGDGRQIDYIYYEVTDSEDALLFRRIKEGHSHAHNMSNEEFLQQGWKVFFCATFTGASEPDYDEEKTFATITQRSTNG